MNTCPLHQLQVASSTFIFSVSEAHSGRVLEEMCEWGVMSRWVRAYSIEDEGMGMRRTRARAQYAEVGERVYTHPSNRRRGLVIERLA